MPLLFIPKDFLIFIPLLFIPKDFLIHLVTFLAPSTMQKAPSVKVSRTSSFWPAISRQLSLDIVIKDFSKHSITSLGSSEGARAAISVEQSLLALGRWSATHFFPLATPSSGLLALSRSLKHCTHSSTLPSFQFSARHWTMTWTMPLSTPFSAGAARARADISRTAPTLMVKLILVPARC